MNIINYSFSCAFSYLRAGLALKGINSKGIPLIPKYLLPGAPFNRMAYNNFIVEASRWNLGSSPVIFDVGANKGDFSQAFRKVYPNARLVLFEPLPELTEHLNFLSRRSRLNFEVHPFALGATDATLPIEIPEGHTAASSLFGFTKEYIRHVPTAVNKVRQNVTVRALDMVTELEDINHIDLLKIDVEGFEFEVLLGASKSLSKVRNLVVEVSRLRHADDECDAIAKMVTHMNDYGFKIHRIVPTIVNLEISRHPVEYDLYFSKY